MGCSVIVQRGIQEARLTDKIDSLMHTRHKHGGYHEFLGQRCKVSDIQNSHATPNCKLEKRRDIFKKGRSLWDDLTPEKQGKCSRRQAAKGAVQKENRKRELEAVKDDG